MTSWPCWSSNVTRLVLILPVPPMMQVLMSTTLLSDDAVANLRDLSNQPSPEWHDVIFRKVIYSIDYKRSHTHATASNALFQAISGRLIARAVMVSYVSPREASRMSGPKTTDATSLAGQPRSRPGSAEASCRPRPIIPARGSGRTGIAIK
jgi:hypothetical protein